MSRGGPRLFKPAKKPSAQSIGQKLELEVVALSDDGRGLGRYQDRPVLIRGALPGERVMARKTGQFRRHIEADLLEVLVASDQRKTPECKFADTCGGCQLQHLSQDDQRVHKQARLLKILSRLGATLEMESLLSPAFEYRHRARLAFQNQKLGFRGATSHEVVDIPNCPLLASSLNVALQQLRALLPEKLGKRELDVILASSVEANRPSRVAVQLRFPKGLPEIDWAVLADALTEPLFLHSVVASDGRHWRPEHSEELPYEMAENLAFGFSPQDFTQVNPVVNQQLVARLLAWLAASPGETVIDYFCGLGNFSIPLAAAGVSVRGYDLGVDMIEKAQAQANSRQLDIQYRSCDLFDPEQLPGTVGATKVILDPPRAGAKLLCERLAANTAIRAVVYVSCDPATLERDLQSLTAGGFVIERAAMVEMFPQSYHAESMVLLTRA